MKEKMKRIMEKFHQYNSGNMAYQVFGLENTRVYDALVIAPSYSPYKLKMDASCKVTLLKESSFTAGYLVEKGGLCIAWIRIASSDANLIDHVSVCAELKFQKMIFIDSVGALKEGFELGEICTPSYSISGGYANTYLKESIRDYVPFERVYPRMDFIDSVIENSQAKGLPIRKVSVFCTTSIALEYYHLEEIKAFGTDLIEMETSSFYLMADLLEIPAIALLVVSDSPATGAALIGRSAEQQDRYEKGRSCILPRMILNVAENP